MKYRKIYGQSLPKKNKRRPVQKQQVGDYIVSRAGTVNVALRESKDPCAMNWDQVFPRKDKTNGS